MDSKALTKVQSMILIAIVAVAAVGGGVAYIIMRGPALSSEDIKIGVCADLDNTIGKGVWHAAILAAEQVNAAGGVLGRNLTIVAEDDDDEATNPDITILSNALTRLITVDKADFIISNVQGPGPVFAHQDIAAEQKKIIFTARASLDNFTQRVLDNYDRYKYFFKLGGQNSTSIAIGMLEGVTAAANLTGFTKFALIGVDGTAIRQSLSLLNTSLTKLGLEVVYLNYFPSKTTDFTSYFAAIDASGAQILVPQITNQAGVPFIKEWHDRQSPYIIWGLVTLAQDSNFWELTEGKCEYVCFSGLPALSGYPLTNMTVPTGEAYKERWGTALETGGVAAVYDGVRFILPDAIRRAGTTETEAVIKALEKTDVETTMARHFVFTSSHDIMVGASGPNRLEEDYVVVFTFQWQENATQVPVSPEQIMEEAGTTLKFPSWHGPWNNKLTP